MEGSDRVRGYVGGGSCGGGPATLFAVALPDTSVYNMDKAQSARKSKQTTQQTTKQK